MDFGKLEDLQGIDFSLPPDDAANALLKKGSAHKKLYVGCTGYSMPAWAGGAYPKGAKAASFLQYYGHQFNTLEQNGTYYRMPDAAAVAKWIAQTPPDFRFCTKVPQMISNSSDLSMAKGVYQEFADSILHLGTRLGTTFMQLPQHFDAKKLLALEKFLDRYAQLLPLTIEARHPQFFESGEARENYFALLSAYNIGAVITDVAGRRDVLHQRITTPQVVLRFVGNGLVPSDYTRIDAWVARWKSWFELGVDSIYCFTHEPDNLLAPEMAAYVVAQAGIHLPEVEVRGPQLPYPIPTSAPQLNLFG